MYIYLSLPGCHMLPSGYHGRNARVERSQRWHPHTGPCSTSTSAPLSNSQLLAQAVLLKSILPGMGNTWLLSPNPSIHPSRGALIATNETLQGWGVGGRKRGISCCCFNEWWTDPDDGDDTGEVKCLMWSQWLYMVTVMEPPPRAHALLPLAPGTGLHSKLAAPGHGAGAPEVSRLPTFLASLSPFPNFSWLLKIFYLLKNRENAQNTQGKKNPKP